MSGTKRVIVGVSFNRGSGQSTLLAAYADWTRQQLGSAAITVLESGDGTKTMSGALPRYLYPNVAFKVIDWPGIGGFRVLDLLHDSLPTSDVIIIDDHGAAEYVPDWSRFEIVQRASEFGYELTVMLFLSAERCEIGRVRDVLKSLGKRAHCIFVRVTKECDTLPSDEWDYESFWPLAQQLQVMTFARMPSAVAGYTSGKVRGIPHTIWQAALDGRDPTFDFVAARVWAALTAEFVRLRPALIPVTSERPHHP